MAAVKINRVEMSVMLLERERVFDVLIGQLQVSYMCLYHRSNKPVKSGPSIDLLRV